MSDDVVTRYVCYPVAWGPASVPSTTRTCEDCGQEVWASLRMQQDPKIRAMRVMCAQCFVKQNPTPKEIMMHPIAAAELREAMVGDKGRKRKDDA